MTFTMRKWPVRRWSYFIFYFACVSAGAQLASGKNNKLEEPWNFYISDFHRLSTSGPMHQNLTLGRHLYSPKTVRKSSQKRHSSLRTARQVQEQQQQDQQRQLLAQYYFVQALGKSDQDGCRNPQPSFGVSCPTGAFIVSQSSKSQWNARLDCSIVSSTTIHCQPRPNQNYTDGDKNGITMACYGSTQQELQISVRVDKGSYFCDKVLNYTDFPASVTTGGTVYQTVAIQQQCLSSVDGSESWKFVEPLCSSVDGDRSGGGRDSENPTLQTSTVAVEYVNGSKLGRQSYTMTLEHCELESNCTRKYTCDPKCTGKTYCYTNMSGFITQTAADVTEATCEPRNFSLGIPTGDPCEFNVMCASDICIDNICQDIRLEDHKPCQEDDDCLSGACGRYPEGTDVANVTATESTTCCPSGGIFGYKGDSYCTASQPVDGYCYDDEMCESNICVFNNCQGSLQEDGMECEEASDCVQGACALYQGTKLCCPGGSSIFYPEGAICSNRPKGDVCDNDVNILCKSNVCISGICQALPQSVGQICDDNGDCANSACALEKLHESSTFVCCPSGDFFYVAQSNNEALPVCTGQPAGTSCGDKNVGGLCTNSTCTTADCKGTPCASIAAICQTGICSDGICQ